MFIASIIGWIIVILSEFFDSVLAGNLINEDALAALELISPVEYIVYALVSFTTHGVGILYSKEIGNQNKLQSQRVAGMGIIINIIFGCIVAIIMYLCAPLYVSAFNCSKVVADYAIEYLQNLSFFHPIYFLFYALYELVTFDGNETLVLFVDIALVVFTIVIPYFLLLNLVLSESPYLIF